MRPGPERIPPSQAPHGMVFRVYDLTGALQLIDRALRPGDAFAQLAEIDAAKTERGGIRSRVPMETTRDPARLVTCRWLRLDRGSGLGACSACPLSVERWDSGDRDLDDLSLSIGIIVDAGERVGNV
ncbi:MAG: hypothetical protein ACT4QB_06940 [Gammaproteobacteria bacterium]